MSGAAVMAVPHMGVVEEVVVLEWLAADGEAVAAGQEVVVVETEKAEVTLEAPASGALRIKAPVSGLEIPVGAVLAMIEG